MGVVTGKLLPNHNYDEIQKTIWGFHTSNSNSRFEDLSKLRINCQLENKVFLYPMGGFLIIDLEELPNEDPEFEAAGIFRHVIEDNFLVNPPKERIFAPWELISIEQKIAFEDELLNEIGNKIPKGAFNFFSSKKHRLSDYEFHAMAKSCSNDDVLFAVNKEGKNTYDYAVIHLTWKGKLEEKDDYPRAEFFEDFDHFLHDRLYPDKHAWET